MRMSGSGGPVVNTAVMSAIAPGHAPSGTTLMRGTTLLEEGGPVGEDVIPAEPRRRSLVCSATSPADGLHSAKAPGLVRCPMHSMGMAGWGPTQPG
jgi:hypothetical protein